jgi:hypothetical protein
MHAFAVRVSRVLFKLSLCLGISLYQSGIVLEEGTGDGITRLIVFEGE